MSLHEYKSELITVTFDSHLCIHAAECVRGLPAVFDTSKRPWIQPEQGTADAIAEVVSRCPSGALQYQRHDGGAAEHPDAHVTVRIMPGGPLHVRGVVEILNGQGEAITTQSRAALCRCGQSANKPFCDMSHIKAGFEKTAEPGSETSVM